VPRQAPRIVATVFLRRGRAGQAADCTPLATGRAMQRLRHSQRYAAQRPDWQAFTRGLRGLPFFELTRGTDPAQAVARLRGLLGRGR
jgi:hypothetical protein